MLTVPIQEIDGTRTFTSLDSRPYRPLPIVPSVHPREPHVLNVLEIFGDRDAGVCRARPHSRAPAHPGVRLLERLRTVASGAVLARRGLGNRNQRYWKENSHARHCSPGFFANCFSL